MKKKSKNEIYLAIAIIISISNYHCSSQTRTNNMNSNSIYAIEHVTLNNVKQYLMIRSENINNPVLLFLHGGPGTSELPLLHYYNSDLEKHFTVVYWEQRGTGKSYSSLIDRKTFTINHFVKDGYDLTLYCLNRFNKNKLILMGHSWGTIIGTKLVLEHPVLYSHYIGIGQEVNLAKGEDIGYRFAYESAIKESNLKAIKELKEIKKPFYLDMSNKSWFKHLKQQRKWVTYYGGVIYGQKDYREVTKLYFKSKEYSFLDMVKFGLGSNKSLNLMWPEIMKVDFLSNALNFQVPVYFIQGKYDYNSPTELVEEYFKKLNAPKKQLYLFSNSAHNPIFEENLKFGMVLREIISDTNSLDENSAR